MRNQPQYKLKSNNRNCQPVLNILTQNFFFIQYTRNVSYSEMCSGIHQNTIFVYDHNRDTQFNRRIYNSTMFADLWLRHHFPQFLIKFGILTCSIIIILYCIYMYSSRFRSKSHKEYPQLLLYMYAIKYHNLTIEWR